MNNGLRLLNLVAQHTFDFVAHCFGADGAEMYPHLVGGFADFFYKGWTLVLWCDDWGSAAGVGCSSCTSFTNLAWSILA